MKKVSKCLILLLAFSFILCRIGTPLPSWAADKISKTEPEFASTPKEDISKLVPNKKAPKATTWIMVLAGVAALAALAGGGGGGGSSSDSSSSSGSVAVGW